MTATQELHNLGQSLWLDNITRDWLDNRTLKRYIDEFSITGLTSNPTIFKHAISKSKFLRLGNWPPAIIRTFRRGAFL
jgi:transaldolase